MEEADRSVREAAVSAVVAAARIMGEEPSPATLAILAAYVDGSLAREAMARLDHSPADEPTSEFRVSDNFAAEQSQGVAVDLDAQALILAAKRGDLSGDLVRAIFAAETLQQGLVKRAGPN